jgi:hypothetical protein
VALRETNRGERVRFYDRPGFNNKPALRRGDSFEDYDLTWFKTHFSANLRRDRDLAAFGNRRFHMIKLSCKLPTGNRNPKSLAASDQSKDSNSKRTPNSELRTRNSELQTSLERKSSHGVHRGHRGWHHAEAAEERGLGETRILRLSQFA